MRNISVVSAEPAGNADRQGTGDDVDQTIMGANNRGNKCRPYGGRQWADRVNSTVLGILDALLLRRQQTSAFPRRF